MLRSDIKKAAANIGFTKDCPGCRAVERNYTSRPMHSDICRRRMEEEIRKTSRGSVRISEFENRLATDIEKRVASENKRAKKL